MGNKVSILVPIYGVEKYIEQCAVSLMEQTYENIEYIFVNDCTKDNSINILREVINRYPQRKSQVQIINHEKNRGLAAARNTALDACSGDYLWHVDSDDYLSLNAIDLLVVEMQRSKADVIIFGHFNVYDDKIKRIHVHSEEKLKYITSLLLNSTPASMWDKFYSASFYRKTGIHSIEGVNQGEDYAVVPRILHQAKNIKFYDEPLYYYNLTNQSSYSRNISLTSIESQKKADDILCEYFKNVDGYKDLMGLLYIRSMLFLIKTSEKKQYKDVLNVYFFINWERVDKLSISDRIIVFLIKRKKFNLCYFIITLYTKL